MGQPSIKQVGGSGTNLGQNFSQFLNQGLLSGTFGSGPGGGNAAGNFQNGIAGILNGILSPGGGDVGNSITQSINNQKQLDLSSLLGKFGAGGGMSFGTPAAFAASNYLGKEAPAATMAVNSMQMGALLPVLNAMMGMGSKDIAQRQTVVGPSPLQQAMGILGPLGGAFSNIFAPSTSGGGGGSGSYSGPDYSGILNPNQIGGYMSPTYSPPDISSLMAMLNPGGSVNSNMTP